MKQIKVLIGILLLAAGATGCSSLYQASAGYASDDLYAVHDRAAIARRQQAEAEAQRAAAEARKAEWEARIAEAEAAAAENRYYEYTSPDANPYESILADDYESAYARRFRGFESPSYKMPSSYLDARYSSAFTYASAYDPAFYNIVISGDQVWVEPKYVTSMFGTWGGTVISAPWYYGWDWPWGPSFSFGSWGWSFGWNSWYNPWYYSSWYGLWGPWYSSWYNPWWGPGWYGWHGHPHWGPGWYGGHYHKNYYANPGGRPYRSYTPGRTSSGRVYGTGSNYGSRGSGTRRNVTYDTRYGSRRDNSPFSSGSRGTRDNYNNSYNNYNSGRNDNRFPNYNSGSRGNSYNSGSYNSGSYNSGSSFGGSRGGSSSGGFGGGGSRGGSVGGGGSRGSR